MNLPSEPTRFSSIEKNAPHSSAAKEEVGTDSQNGLQSTTKSIPAAKPLSEATTETPAVSAKNSAAADLQIPCRFGDYDLLAEIGKGGMGVVYKARQRSANRFVALKLIRPDQLSRFMPEDRRQVLARFRNEVQAAAQLEHDHVVTIYDVGEIDGQSYYAMRYVDGESLKGRISQGPLEPDVAARYVQQVARALGEAHARGILHRDLKPHNVMVDVKTDRALLADFGLAKLSDGDQQLTAASSALGSPPYMSPEQTLDSGKVTAASDIYGLGATLYHLITGRPPFAAANAMATMMQVQNQDPVSPRALNHAVPLDLETVCLKCLEKDPERRYASANDLAEELGRYLRHEPILARSVSVLEQSWRWCKRNPTVAGLSAAIALVLVMGIVVSSTLAIIAEQRAKQLGNANKQLGDTNQQLGAVNQQVGAANLQLGDANSRLKTKQQALENEQQKVREVNQQLGAANQQLLDANARLTTKQQALETEQQKVLKANVELAKALGEVTAQKNNAERELRKFELMHYHDRIDKASGALNSHDFATTRIELDLCPEKFRNVEHAYLYRQLDMREPFILRGHGHRVSNLAIAQDGLQLCSGSNGTIKIWDLSRGKETFTLRGHTWGEISLAFSPNGRRLYSGGEDGTIKVWDLEAGKETFTLRGHTGRVSSLAISPDGERLYSGSSSFDGTIGSHVGTIKVWDLKTDKETLTLKGHAVGVCSLVLAPDGRRLYSGGYDQTIKVWDLDTGKETRTLQGHTGKVNCLAISSDGLRLYSGDNVVDNAGRSLAGGTIKVWDLKSGKETLTLLGHTKGVSSLALSPDGRRLYSGSADDTIKAWDLETGKETLTLPGHTVGVYSLALSPDGQRLYSGSGEYTESTQSDTKQMRGIDGIIKVWDLKTGKEALTLRGHTSAVNSLTLTTDGRRLCSGSHDRTIKLWDLETEKETVTLGEHSAPVQSLVFSPDSHWLYSGSSDRTIKVWDLETLKEKSTLRGHTGTVSCLALSFDGQRLYSGSGSYIEPTPRGELAKQRRTWTYDGTIKVWDLKTGKTVTLHGHRGSEVDCLVFSPDGRRLYSGSADNTIKAWDLETGKETLTLLGHTSKVSSLSISSNGRWLYSASSDRTIRVWDLVTGKETLSLRGHTGPVYCLVNSPDDRRLYSGSADQTIKVWDLETGKETLTLHGHGGYVNCLALSPDGRRLYSGSADQTIKVWDFTLSDHSRVWQQR